MAALDSLRREHALIARGLDALEAYAAMLEAGRAYVREDLAPLAAFFSEFADLWHQEKEEDILWPALVRHGYAWDEGPIARVRGEHEQENYLIRVLHQAALQEGAPTEEELRHIVATIRSLVAFERGHMREEEAVLYRAVAEELPEEAQEEIERRAAELEQKRFPGGSYPESAARAEALFTRYLGAGEGLPGP